MMSIDLRSPRLVLVAFLLLLRSPAAIAVAPGTYEGGFDTPSDTLKVQLRCATPTTPRPVCELETFARSGKKKEGLKPRPDVVELLGGCRTAPTSQWEECDLGPWNQVREALTFAREHQQYLKNKEAGKQLQPIFSGRVSLSKCVRFSQTESVVFCDVASSPWGRPAILYFSELFGPCSAEGPFCQFFVLPLFKTSEAAELKGFGVLAPAAPAQAVPESQAQVAPYIAQLEEAVHGALKIPPGTPPTARLTYQVQFSQVIGTVLSVNFTGGCFCPDFRAQVRAAVVSLTPFPLLPESQRSIVGERTGRVYLETHAH